MRIRHFACGTVLLLFASFPMPGHAATLADTPSTFVTALVQKALFLANSKTLSPIERRRRLEGLVDESFDMPAIARYVLGDYWQTANQTEQQKFIEVLRDSVLSLYSLQLVGYESETFRIVGQRADGATRTMVYSEISRPSSERRVTIGWYINDVGGYRIIDLNFESISMVLTKRHEFGSFLRRNGGDVASLIDRLR